jgi:hypothetical protein
LLGWKVRFMAVAECEGRDASRVKMEKSLVLERVCQRPVKEGVRCRMRATATRAITFAARALWLSRGRNVASGARRSVDNWVRAA